MARVYYREKKLIGEPVRHNAINPFVFENILTKTNPAKNDYFIFNLKSELDLFTKALVWDGDFWFTHKEQKIYLPKAIIFGKDFSTPYPDEYYFIAYIQGDIEVRKVQGGIGVTFEDTIDISQEVTEESVITKIDNSMIVINKRISEFESKKQKIQAALQVSTSTNPDILKAYDKISELCGWSENQRDLLQKHILTQKVGDDIYEIRNIVLDYCCNKEQELFIYLDWKDTVEEFVWELQKILKHNFGINETIPLRENNLETPVYEEGVFEYFNANLNQHNLELIGLETNGDDYQIIVNWVINHEEIIQNINSIGFEIWEV